MICPSSDVDFFHLRPEAALSKSLKCIELALPSNETYAEVSSRLSASRALVVMGRLEEAQAQATAMLILGLSPLLL